SKMDLVFQPQVVYLFPDRAFKWATPCDYQSAGTALAGISMESIKQAGKVFLWNQPRDAKKILLIVRQFRLSKCLREVAIIDDVPRCEDRGVLEIQPVQVGP